MLEYLRIGESGVLPDMSRLKPYKAVVIIENPVTRERQDAISDWLVRSGCLYMLAWGPGCSSWDDSVDMANLERFGFRDIPSRESVMTTWHEKETLEEVFAFTQEWAKAHDPSIRLENVLLLHLGAADKGVELKKKYEAAAATS